jgi:hypothetical protein
MSRRMTPRPPGLPLHGIGSSHPPLGLTNMASLLADRSNARLPWVVARSGGHVLPERVRWRGPHSGSGASVLPHRAGGAADRVPLGDRATGRVRRERPCPTSVTVGFGASAGAARKTSRTNDRSRPLLRIPGRLARSRTVTTSGELVPPLRISRQLTADISRVRRPPSRKDIADRAHRSVDSPFRLCVGCRRLSSRH